MYDSIYIFGELVKDFHVLDKQKIFALHHPAIQEIDKQFNTSGSGVVY